MMKICFPILLQHIPLHMVFIIKLVIIVVKNEKKRNDDIDNAGNKKRWLDSDGASALIKVVK